MAQPPFKADIIQIEPSASGTRTISRDTGSGELLFKDTTFPLGVTLADMVGLQSIQGVLVVGQEGGAPYTTIQAALDDIPASSSPTNPYVVLVYPGIYPEKLTLSRDGVTIIAQGLVVVTNNDSDPTVHITQDADSVPRAVELRGLVIEAADGGAACIFVDGSNTFATGGFSVVTAPLVAGDKITVGGVDLVGVAAGRTSGSNNFNCSLGTTAALAAEIVSALNDVSNDFADVVEAVLSSSDIQLQAVAPGTTGNAITTTAATTPSGGLVAATATLTGGGGLNSEVGLVGVQLTDCILQATGVGSYQLRCDTVNAIRIVGGSWAGSSSTSVAVAAQTGSLSLQGVAWVNNIEVAYDTGNPEPAGLPEGWSLFNVPRVGTVLINLIGAGSTSITNCPMVGHTTHNGDRTFRAVGSGFGAVLVEDTVAATFVSCTRGSVGGAGSGTLAETQVVGAVSFVSSTSETVTFDVAQPDDGYTVTLDCPSATVQAAVVARTTTDFEIATSAGFTGTIRYVLSRQLP